MPRRRWASALSVPRGLQLVVVVHACATVSVQSSPGRVLLEREVVDGFLERGGSCGPHNHEVRRLRQDEEAMGVLVGVEPVVGEVGQVRR